MQRLLCDTMLGRLARWLRMLGYDTHYAAGDLRDDTIMAIAQDEGRMLLTRDTAFAARAKKRGMPVLLIHSTDFEAQLVQVMDALSITAPTLMAVRCTLCNTVLEPREKDAVRDRVPETVFAQTQKFWQCPSCRTVYWEGTHWNAMRDTLHRIKEKRH